jgi:hypothetical protein
MFDKKLEGLHYGNRIILPFHCIFLKAVVNRDIIMDFSPKSKYVSLTEDDNSTSLYFHKYENLRESISEFEAIKLVIVEKGKNIFDFANHIKLAVYLDDKHKLRIEKTNDDILFIE